MEQSAARSGESPLSRPAQRPSTWRTATVIALALILAATLAPFEPPRARAQDEAGKNIQFPFRDGDGNITWVAKAQSARRIAELPHPLKFGEVAEGYRFERQELAGPDGKPQFSGHGVEVIIPFEPGEFARGGAEPSGEGEQVARLVADVCTFFRADELLEFRGVDLEVSAGSDIGPFEGEIGAATDGHRPANRARRLPPTQLSTDVLYLQWQRDPKTKRKFIRIFTDDVVSLAVPLYGLTIRRARGFLAVENDPLGRLHLFGDVDGQIGNAAWLNLGAPSAYPYSRPRTQFRAVGECVFFFGPQFRQNVQRITMDRAVDLLQLPDRRLLRCNHLDVSFDHARTPPGVAKMVAENRVALHIPGNLKARSERLAFDFATAADGMQTQTAELTGVRRVSLYSTEPAVGPMAPTPNVGGPDVAPGAERMARTRVRIDAMANEKIRLHRVVPPEAETESLGSRPAGRETWELTGFAKLTRFASDQPVRGREPDFHVPDFGVPFDPEKIGGTPDEWERIPTGDIFTGDPADADFRLTGVLNGSDRHADTPSNGPPDGGEAPDGVAAEHPARVGQTGSITLAFELRTGGAMAGGGTVLRELSGLVVKNPGVLPVLELKAEAAGIVLRCFANELTVTNVPQANGEIGETAVFRGENPQVTWLTPRNLFSMYAVPVPDAVVFQYLVDADGEFTLSQSRDPRTGAISRRHFEFPGHVRLRKAPYTGLDVFEQRLVIDCDCRDLKMGFDSRFNGELECNFIAAKAPVPGADGTPLTLILGLDRLTCAAVQYAREPAGDFPRAAQDSAGHWLPASWTETIVVDGPIRAEFRDPESRARIPFTDHAGDLVVPAYEDASIARRLTVRHTLARTPDESLVVARRLAAIGPFSMRALTIDPAKFRSGFTAPKVLTIEGQTASLDLDRVEFEGQSYERLTRAAFAGGVAVDYVARGMFFSGQLLDYRHNPLLDGPSEPRLRVVGDPAMTFTSHGSANAGTLRVMFPATDNPVLRASRSIELIGEPTTIHVRPRGGLHWRPRQGEPLMLEANELDIELFTTDVSGVPPEVRTARRQMLGPLGVGIISRFSLHELRGIGNVLLGEGLRRAVGETFVWRQPARTDNRYAHLWGPDAKLSQYPSEQTGFELSRATALPQLFPQSWLPPETDPTAMAPEGTTYRYQARDPRHPDREDIITAGSDDRMKLKITVPR